MGDGLESLFENDISGEGDSLSVEHLLRAIWEIKDKPERPAPYVLRDKREWEDLKKLFKLTDEQMERLFVISDYLSPTPPNGEGK